MKIAFRINRTVISGFQNFDVTDKITYTTQEFFQADSPLHSSGLMGPTVVSKTMVDSE
jgi:hypothetical protein